MSHQAPAVYEDQLKVHWTRENKPDDNPPVRYHLTFKVGTVTACISTVRVWGESW